MMEDIRMSSRILGKRPVVEENTIDEAIDVEEEDYEDDFVTTNYTNKQVAAASNVTPVKWKKRLIVARSRDVPIGVKEKYEIKNGKKRGDDHKKLQKKKKQKGEAANAGIEAGPSRSRKDKKKVKKPKSDQPTLRTRSSPKATYLALATLNPSQQYCVAKMGFGSLIDFKVDGIPSRLGFYVVDMFDADSMEIKLKKGSLKITKEIIGDMLGLRNEGENILMNKVPDNEEMIKDWINQFNVPEKDISPIVIKSKIRRSKVVDFNFKLNIIVLFANVMGCCKKTGV